MPPKMNPDRARFVLLKIDEILAWEKRRETERDTRFVELGRYLCEVSSDSNPLMSSWNVGFPLPRERLFI
jgi:hypothetical protein